jgi:hypothetical protein
MDACTGIRMSSSLDVIMAACLTCDMHWNIGFYAYHGIVVAASMEAGMIAFADTGIEVVMLAFLEVRMAASIDIGVSGCPYIGMAISRFAVISASIDVVMTVCVDVGMVACL